MRSLLYPHCEGIIVEYVWVKGLNAVRTCLSTRFVISVRTKFTRLCSNAFLKIARDYALTKRVQYSVQGLIPDSKIFWPTKAEISGICSDIYFLGDRVENG